MITLRIAGSDETRNIDVSAVAVAGYTGRDRAAVERHIKELQAMGIPAPKTTPVLFAVTGDRLSQGPTIDVVGPSTSGEVEFVLIADADGEFFITVGSDHTDRELEKADIPASKQACPKPIGREAWRLSEVEGDWDRMVIRSWVTGVSAPYQEGKVSGMMTPRELIEFVGRRAPGPLVNVAIFSGTVPLSTSSFVPADRFRGELSDPISGRRLSIDYAVRPLGWRTDP